MTINHAAIEQSIVDLKKLAQRSVKSDEMNLLEESHVRIHVWWLALQKIATGDGDGASDAEVMRGIAREALGHNA